MNVNTETKSNTEDLNEAQVSKIDFKMVTFTLAGKDYGIDIMKVKEIHKAEKFTFVPNSAPFVKGVYNMRGDIISVIDLRIFFNLPVEDNNKKFENMIILRLEDHTIGILVDTIEKVIGIDSSRKQPPHPLFGDINIKYIDSVVENDNSLYIILDAEKIFNMESSSDTVAAVSQDTPVMSPVSTSEDTTFDAGAIRSGDTDRDLNLGFIEETLPGYAGFHPSGLNKDWIKERFESWKKERGTNKLQLENRDDAASYLRGFYSPYTGELWGDEYLNAVSSALSDKSGNVFVWNPGCGRGYETYSLAVLLKRKNPDIILKVQGNDNDLINISSAPGLIIDKSKTSALFDPYLVSASQGYQFNQEIKDSVIFEYHDLQNDTALPRLDLAVCRDTLSFMEEAMQVRILDNIYNALKPGGVLIVGHNEVPFNESRWDVIESKGLKLYKKK